LEDGTFADIPEETSSSGEFSTERIFWFLILTNSESEPALRRNFKLTYYTLLHIKFLSDYCATFDHRIKADRYP
jgi:hypothetical protein